MHGLLQEAVLVGSVLAGGWAFQRAVRGRTALAVLGTAAATWAVLGGRSLARESEPIAHSLAAGDPPGSRRQVSNLVSRDPELRTRTAWPGHARIGGGNTSDAVVASLFWGAVAGTLGLLTYWAVNTLDAMVGYRNDRYDNFGSAVAKLDDLANWVPELGYEPSPRPADPIRANRLALGVSAGAAVLAAASAAMRRR